MDFIMSDVYVECLVQARKSGLKKVVQVLLIVLTVIFGLGMIIFWPMVLPAIITGVVAYFVGLYSQVEYEYLYLDKELSVDRILAQSKRKRVAAYSLDRMEIFAPVNSWHLDSFKNRNVKVEDYSGEEQDKCYCMYYEGGLKVVLSPSEDMVKALKNVAPRKVFND